MLIEINKNFPHLSRAPIVEAVIEIRSNIERPWDEQTSLALIKKRIPEYPIIETQRGYQHTFSAGPDQPPHQAYADLGFRGFRLISSDKLQISFFGKESYSFSRLFPYENWSRFSAEALRMWNLYKELSGSGDISRFGVRFINKISLPGGDLRFGDYLVMPPSTPPGLELPLTGFFHHDTIVVPDYGYFINFIQTIQSLSDGVLHLILDIDVFIEKIITDNNDILLKHLEEMRYLKNSVFFNSITKKTLE